jgi:hypothetical protein
MDNVYPLRGGPAGTGLGGGSGPEDPMLEARVGRLEECMKEVRAVLARLEPMIIELVHTTAKKSDIERIEARLAETREEVKEMKGALSRSPTINHLLAATISTWIAGAGIVFALTRLPAP